MHYLILAAWSGFHFSGGGIIVWFFGLIAAGWLGIRWWGAHIEQQFERDQPAKTRVDWQLSNLLKVLLSLLALLIYVFASML